MRLAFRRKSKADRVIDAASDLAKIWAGAKLTKGTARAGRKAAKLKMVGGTKPGRFAAIGKAATSPTGRDAGRKALETALAVKAAKGVAKKKRGGGGSGRKLLVLGGAAAAVAIALKARKQDSGQQPPT